MSASNEPAPAPAPQPDLTGIPPLITLEEHFLSEAAPRAPYAEQFKALPELGAQLADLGTRRLADMDAGGVSLQVISHGPGLSAAGADACRAANEQMAAAVARQRQRREEEAGGEGAGSRGHHHPRFAALAVLCMADPNGAAAELRRCVHEHGFVGALIDNHDGHGGFYDGPRHDAFWSAAEELYVPVYLHPAWPTAAQREYYSGVHIAPGAAASLGSSGFGWHADVHVHVLRLFAAGVFDRFPMLRLVVGHFGEMLPFMLARTAQLSARWGRPAPAGGGGRTFAQVYRESIWVTTSGVWSVDPLATVLRNTPVEHVLYSVDYPFADNRAGLRWVRELRDSGLVTSDQLEMICYKNAEKLLRLSAPPREAQ